MNSYIKKKSHCFRYATPKKKQPTLKTRVMLKQYLVDKTNLLKEIYEKGKA